MAWAEICILLVIWGSFFVGSFPSTPPPPLLVYWSALSYLHAFDSGLGDTAELLAMVHIDLTLGELHYTWATSAQSMLS